MDVMDGMEKNEETKGSVFIRVHPVHFSYSFSGMK